MKKDILQVKINSSQASFFQENKKKNESFNDCVLRVLGEIHRKVSLLSFNTADLTSINLASEGEIHRKASSADLFLGGEIHLFDNREITITKAGILYGVSRWTMRRYILKGKLKPSRVSRLGNRTKNFYYLADIETLFASERQQ